MSDTRPSIFDLSPAEKLQLVCIEHICRQPLSYPVAHETYRRALVRRFPYARFFEYEEPVATIYGVLHTSRDPGKWRQRLL